MLLRRVASYAVPLGAALAAFLQARAVGALIDGTTSPADSIAPFAEARAAVATRHESDDEPDVRWLDVGAAAGALPVRATVDAIWIGDRVWLSCHGSLCEARVLARPGSPAGPLSATSTDVDGPRGATL